MVVKKILMSDITELLDKYIEFSDELKNSLNEYFDNVIFNISSSKSGYLCSLRDFNCFIVPYFNFCMSYKNRDFYAVNLRRSCCDSMNSFIEKINDENSEQMEFMNLLMKDSSELISKLRLYQYENKDKNIITDEFNHLEELLNMDIIELSNYYMTVDKSNLKSKGVLLTCEPLDDDSTLTVNEDGSLLTYVVDDKKKLVNSYGLIKSEAVKLLNKSCVSSVNKMLELLINCASLMGNYQCFNESITNFVGRV